MKTMDHVIDAKQKHLGRLASQVAGILQGKNTPAYNPRLEGEGRVVVKNAAQIELTGKKVEQKRYYKHTGPLGHLKERKFKDVVAKNPGWVIRRAVMMMLPKNKLQAKRMKRLIIEQ